MAIERIVSAYDFSEPGARALVWAHGFARSLSAQLHVVHVHPDIYDGHSEPAVGLPWPTEGQEERYLRFLDEELLRTLRAKLGDGAESIVRHIVRGDPVKRLLAVAEEVHADVICVGSTGKGAVQRVMLGSVSLSTVRMSKVPVVVVP